MDIERNNLLTKIKENDIDENKLTDLENKF